MFGISKSLLNTKSITRCPNEEDSPLRLQRLVEGRRGNPHPSVDDINPVLP